MIKKKSFQEVDVFSAFPKLGESVKVLEIIKCIPEGI
jgi:hypothetical protein